MKWKGLMPAITACFGQDCTVDARPGWSWSAVTTGRLTTAGDAQCVANHVEAQIQLGRPLTAFSAMR